VPACGYRELELVPVLDGELKGGLGGPLGVPSFGVARVGPLGGLDRVRQATRPHRRLGENLQILRVEPSLCISGLQEVEGLLPRTAFGRFAAGLARILDDLTHVGVLI
jgi:hypothetical protein